MSLIRQFNIGHNFITDADIVILKHEGKIDTYRYREPIEHPQHPDWYVIPSFSLYLTNREGEVYSLRSNKILKYSVTKPNEKKNITGGYYILPAVNDFDSSATLRRHRLKLLVFTTYDFHPETMWVNHINGIPGDDRWDNLEWVTPADNIKHAYDNGLYPNKVRPVTVANWITDFEQEYRSIAEACLENNLLLESMYTRLRRENNDTRFDDGWRIKYSEDTWKPLKDRIDYHNEAPVYARDIRDNRVYTYPSIREASIGTKVNYTTIKSHCIRMVKSPSSYFNFRYVNNFEGWPEYTADQLELIGIYNGNNGPLAVLAFDQSTGDRLWLRPLDEVAKILGLSPITVTKIANAKKVREGIRYESVSI